MAAAACNGGLEGISSNELPFRIDRQPCHSQLIRTAPIGRTLRVDGFAPSGVT